MNPENKEPTTQPKKVTPSATPSKQNKVILEDAPEEDDIEQIEDPLDKALAAKSKGNKYFKGGRYELAIKCYSQAIEVCPEGKKSDLATFYQNRAAAYEQLVSRNPIYSFFKINVHDIEILYGLLFNFCV